MVKKRHLLSKYMITGLWESEEYNNSSELMIENKEKHQKVFNLKGYRSPIKPLFYNLCIICVYFV